MSTNQRCQQGISIDRYKFAGDISCSITTENIKENEVNDSIFVNIKGITHNYV